MYLYLSIYMYIYVAGPGLGKTRYSVGKEPTPVEAAAFSNGQDDMRNHEKIHGRLSQV